MENTSSSTREERYKQLLSPFEEFLPDMRPSNSEAYLTLLASRMRSAGVAEEDVCRRILADSPFPLEEPSLAALVRLVFSAPADAAPTLSKVQSKSMAMRTFFDRRYLLRFNEVLDAPEYRERKRFHNNWRVVNDKVINSMVVNAQEEGIDLWDRDVRRYLLSDRVCPYNPIDEYLASLPAWDHYHRIDTFFHRVPVDEEAWYPLMHTWFLGMVALWSGASRRKGNETMPILVGEQGVGKSTFCRALLPPELTAYYTENFALTDRRKALLMLTRYGLINFDEVNRLTERQHPVLKNMLQLPMVEEYKPYAASSSQLQRYASLIGTSNEMGVIADLTGSRRYLCAKVTGHINMKRPVNYPQLYAEALHEIKEGRRYWLDEAEEAALTERNTRFVRMPANAELFDLYFDIARPNEKGAKWLYATEINQRLHPTQYREMTNGDLRRFSEVMNAYHVLTRRATLGMQYLVKPKEM